MSAPQATVNVATSQPTNDSSSKSLISGPQTVSQNITNAASNEQNVYVEDKFWPRPETDYTKWDKYCPYQLLVVQADVDSSGVSHYKPFKDWQYTLPLPPESMTVMTPFAIQTTVTLGGVVEEHNAAPLKYISFAGTTGFLPLRTSGATKEGTGAIGQLESIFGGTVSTIKSAGNSFAKSASALVNSAPKATNLYQQASFDINKGDKNLIKTSGFSQIGLLRDFLESYVAKKKLNDAESKTLRLAVAIWKEDTIYLVTPVNFNVTKDVSSPMEYRYQLSFKAWRRITLNASDSSPVSPAPIRRSPNAIARAINVLTAARQAVQMIGTLKQAVLGDIDYIFKPFHDTILLGKDLLGTTLSLADIPLAVKQRISINVSELKHNSSQLWNTLSSSQTWDPAYKALKYTFDDSTHIQDMPVGVRGSVMSSGQSRNRASSTTRSGIKPRIISMKNIPDQLADQIPVSSLNLPTDVTDDILADLTRIRQLRRKDFEDYANIVRNTADKIAFLVGAGDPTYAETYGINIAPIKTTPTQSDWDSLNALNDAVDILQQFAATADGEPAAAPTTLDRFGGLAVISGIAWQKPVSKFSIPFPYGATLEGLASQYLGDPNRYLEIVALNGLRAPYIDEVGYKLPILTNGKDKTIVIAQNDDLYVGKIVWLSSNACNRGQFSITSIQNKNGTSTIQLSDNVDAYRVADGAQLESFLSGTVCSRNLIWIPSDVDPLDLDSVITKDIPGVDTTDPMVSIGGVDLLLGPDNDFVVVDGELKYAIGVANIVQWVRTLFLTRQGELLEHPTIGLPLSIGLSLADFSAQDIMNAVKDQLKKDSTFSRIDKIDVTQNGAAVNIKIQAVVRGTSSPLPLTYGVKLTS